MKYLNNYKIFEKFNIDLDYRDIYRELIEDYELDVPDINYLIEKSTEFISKIQSLMVGDTIQVYRHMYVSFDWIESVLNNETYKLGNSWAYNKDIAYSWDSSGDTEAEILLTAEIDIKYIDWSNTIILYFIFGRSESESELSLRYSTKFKLISLERLSSDSTYNKKDISKKHDINKDGYTM
jgi:hypothetical protein